CVKGGKIIVRTAKENEVIKTLDGNDRKLTENMLCICDSEKPVAVAGVMGGANSEIVGDTAMVVFESACFNGTSIRKTALALGMRTDASGRYEKGLDPMNTVPAVERACELIELLEAGEVLDGHIDVVAVSPKEVRLPLEPERVNALLGTDISREFMVKVLEKLDFTMDGNTICVPSFRSDIAH
ncbi:MAG: phenylalanine--tRNA ligase beta subunit-related protein, partial [Oscillospiraceae bacterium]